MFFPPCSKVRQPIRVRMSEACCGPRGSDLKYLFKASLSFFARQGSFEVGLGLRNKSYSDTPTSQTLRLHREPPWRDQDRPASRESCQGMSSFKRNLGKNENLRGMELSESSSKRPSFSGRGSHGPRRETGSRGWHLL